MALINALNNPKISDTVLFVLNTTDGSDNPIDPFKVDQIIIYHLERSFTDGNQFLLTDIVTDSGEDVITTQTYHNEAIPIKTFGNSIDPAWLSTDLDAAFIERTDTGEFELEWNPEFAREGDYIICWSWTPLPAADKLANSFKFRLSGDQNTTISVPTHKTPIDKYYTLLERYLPETYKIKLGDGDLTPETLDNLNLSIGDGFTVLEDLSNQIYDLIDSNAVTESLLPFLASLFSLTLRSNDVTLWRRQIKTAVPLYKKKGTLTGLTEALDQAGIDLEKFTFMYQVASPYTFEEVFTVEEDQEAFILSKLAIITPSIDADNFALYFRADGDDTFIELSLDYVSFSEATSVTTMTWVGDALSVDPIILAEGDTIRILYKIKEPTSQSVEDYIRSLPLMDKRDDITAIIPPKNWNTRLIAEDDSMLSVVCPKVDALHNLLTFGYIRTEFPYSENIYNMEEYNGGVYPSADPCNIDQEFIDPCNCCASSKFIIDLSVQELSDARIEEATAILNEYKPFHALAHTINFSSQVEEIIPPPFEEVEFLVQMKPFDFITIGQKTFNRTMEGGDTTNAIRRTALASSATVAVANGTIKNDEVVIFSPTIRFDQLGVISNNILEILSGVNTGEYKVSSPNKFSIGITQGTPDTISESPIDKGAIPFRLSNILFSGSVTTITQDNKFILTDDNIEFRNAGVAAGWKITVSAPASVIGTYNVIKSFPDDSVTIADWPIDTNLTGITYTLKTGSDEVIDTSTTGAVSVTKRGKVDAGTDLRDRYVLEEGDYASVGSTQYRILEFESASKFFIDSWDSGDVGVSVLKVYRRLLDNKVGYLDYRGITLETPIDHENGLGISNGANEFGPLLENDKFKENFLILINGSYYRLIEIDITTMTLAGPIDDFSLSGTSVQYSIIHYTKTSPITVDGIEFQRIDRRNNEIVTFETQAPMSMMALSNYLNSDGFNDAQFIGEGVTMEIEYK